MITLVGVGHVFDIKDSVREIIIDRKPNVVCVELDRTRYQALRAERKGARGTVPVGYRLLSHFQNRIAKKYGGKPGDEMLAAIDTAIDLKIDVAFIDVEAAVVFNEIWNRMSFKEKVKLLSAGFFGMFVGKKRVEKELKHFDENRDEYLSKFGDEFPVVKKILVDDRDRNMARAILELNKKYPGVIAVIGDGHVDGVNKLLESLSPDVIRLKDILSGTWCRDSNRSVTISFSRGAA